MTDTQRTTYHIVVVASYFYPKIGGVENYAYLLAKNLHASKLYTVSVITSNHENTGYICENIDGIRVYRLPISFKVSNTPIHLMWYSYVKKILAKEKPDLIHVHSPVPYLPDIVAWVGKKYPLVLTYHSGSMLKGSWPIDMLIYVYEKVFLRKLFRQSKAVVAISQEFAKKTFPEFSYKTSFIPTGVDLQRFRKTPLPQTQRITFVGRIERSSSWKGIEPLLQAMVLVVKKCPQAVLELVGGGDAIMDYTERANELGISDSVIFSGPQLGNNLVQAYERSAVVVLPSTSDSEAFSVTLVEAMACGRPIIGTAIGGTPQVIENGKNGLLVAPNNPVQLAEAICMVLTDKKLAIDLAEYGAQKSQSFSWDIQAKKYSDLFQSIFKTSI